MTMIFRHILVLFILLFVFQNINAKRVVSLVPSITQSIISLQAQNQLVGITSFCPVVEGRHIEIVASAVDANVEKIVTLKPDVVFTSSLNKPQTIETFKKLGIKVINLDYPKTYNEICEQFKTIASEVGQTELATAILNEQNQRLSKLKEKSTKNKPLVFMEIGAKPLFTVVPNTFMHDMIEYAGAKNLAEDLSRGTISREAVLMRNPEFIFIVTMGIVTNEEIDIWKQYTNLKAVKNKHIYVLDPYKACTPTPQNFVDTVSEMINLLHK